MIILTGLVIFFTPVLVLLFALWAERGIMASPPPTRWLAARDGLARALQIFGRLIRRSAILVLDISGLGLIIYGSFLWSAIVGFLISGLIAIGVGVLLTPQPPPESSGSVGEQQVDTGTE